MNDQNKFCLKYKLRNASNIEYISKNLQSYENTKWAV